MKDLLLVLLFLMFAMSLRSGCEKSSQGEIAKDCQLVCSDIGFDHDYAVKTGWFTYQCKCKRKQEPAKINGRP